MSGTTLVDGEKPTSMQVALLHRDGDPIYCPNGPHGLVLRWAYTLDYKFVVCQSLVAGGEECGWRTDNPQACMMSYTGYMKSGRTSNMNWRTSYE